MDGEGDRPRLWNRVRSNDASMVDLPADMTQRVSVNAERCSIETCKNDFFEFWIRVKKVGCLAHRDRDCLFQRVTIDSAANCGKCNRLQSMLVCKFEARSIA